MTLRSFFFYWSYCLIHTMISFMMNSEKRVIEVKLKEGQKVYYLIGGFVESGHVIDLEKKPYGYIFRLDSYGGCEGQYTIDESQIGISVFLTEEEAKSHMHEQNRSFPAYC